jgi:intracellular sulfur oxidation DsrE/DsrF family protein
MKHALLTTIIIVVLAGCLAVPLASQTVYDNNPGLKGLDKIQVYFDVNVKDDNLLAYRMELIDHTIRQMAEAGVEVAAVIGFRGGASRFITADDHYVLAEELANKKKVQDWVVYFSDRGTIIEQCAIGAEINQIELQDFLPEVKVVGNGYISMAGYQTRGYALIPMD